MGKKIKVRKNKKAKTLENEINDAIAVAQAHYQAERLKETEEVCMLILQHDQNNAEAVHLLGLTANKTCNYKAAVELISKAIEIDPHQAHFSHNIGTVYSKMGRLDDAINAFRTALKLKPDSLLSTGDLGAALLDANQVEEAIDCFEKILAVNPDSKLVKEEIMSGLAMHRFQSYNIFITEQITKLYHLPGVNYKDLAQGTFVQLKLKHDIQAERLLEYPEKLYSLLNDNLFLLYITKTKVFNPEMESILTKIRRALLFNQLDEKQFAHNAIISALASQCFYNEYLYLEDEDEKRECSKLKKNIENDISGEVDFTDRLETDLMLYAMYAPIYTLHTARELAQYTPERFSPEFKHIFELTLKDFLEEQEIKNGLETIADINDVSNEVSAKVRSQYEENPYPRWMFINRPAETTLKDMLKQYIPHAQAPATLSNSRLKILVAGCGTGQHPIFVALKYKNADVLAVDLSKNSLAYAVRMAHKIGTENIRFLHGDILSLGKLEERFDMIHCGGVLHHMENPADGLKVLVDLLKPGGLIKLGLYSEKARQHIVKVRDMIREKGIKPDKDSIKNFRQYILKYKEDKKIYYLRSSGDFYSMSDCRDLLFHVQEHRFTIPQLKELIDNSNLTFLRFELGRCSASVFYSARFPEDPYMSNLLNMDVVENAMPNTFSKMYLFWCQKKA